METKFNFKSQPATSIEQSERLLALGLRKETADMTHHYLYSTDSYELKDIEFSRIMHLQELVNKKPVLGRSGDDLYAKDIPAWGLHRLIEMMPKSIHFENEDWYKIIYNNSVCYQRGQFSICRSCKSDLYVDIINCIEWLIKEGYFNKEYLDE